MQSFLAKQTFSLILFDVNPKKILGVDENATQAEIQQAYRRQARKHHPDLGGDEWAFQQVHDAYQSLTGSTSDIPRSVRPEAQETKGKTPPAEEASGKRASVKTNSGSPQKHPSAPTDDQRQWWQFFTGKLPLENETTTFILINCLDIFMTYTLLRRGAIEANPIANYFYQNWNFNGMIFFKLVTVAAVCVIAQVVAWKKPRTARFLLIFGSLIVGAVVIYSLWLGLTKVF